MPDSPQGFAPGWRQVAICFLLLAATGMIASTYSIIAVPIGLEFQPSRAVLMLSMTVLSGACAILAPLLGNVMDRVSLRLLMTLGGLSLAAGYFTLSFAGSFNQVLVVFAVLLAPANVLIGPVATTVLLTRWFSQKRGRAIGIAIAGIAAGGFFFPMIIQALLDGNEWREAMRLLALVLLVWTVPAALLVIDRPAIRGLYPDGAAAPPASARRSAGSAPPSVREIVLDPVFWMLCVTVAVVTSGMKGMITNLAPLAIDAGVPARDAAKLISTYAACGFIAKIAFAALADRLGPRVLMLVALGGFACGMAFLAQGATSFFSIAFGVAIIGLFGGLMVPLESFIAPRVFGERVVGRAMGLISGGILLAMLVTPPLFGLIHDLTGSYKAIFWTFGGLALATLALVPIIRLHQREEPGEPVPAPAE
jgi:MFS family permease